MHAQSQGHAYDGTAMSRAADLMRHHLEEEHG